MDYQKAKARISAVLLDEVDAVSGSRQTCYKKAVKPNPAKKKPSTKNESVVSDGPLKGWTSIARCLGIPSRLRIAGLVKGSSASKPVYRG